MLLCWSLQRVIIPTPPPTPCWLSHSVWFPCSGAHLHVHLLLPLGGVCGAQQEVCLAAASHLHSGYAGTCMHG